MAGGSTIGVAIAVPEPYAAELQDMRASFGDPLAALAPAHVTLLPPTAVQDGELDEVRRHLAQVSSHVPPFDMRLQGTDTFRPVSPVVFVRVAAGVDECRRVEREVRSGVLDRDVPFDYHPHVTVAHHLSDEAMDTACEALADYEAAFHVSSIHLYRHNGDGVWRVEGVFPLKARDGTATEARDGTVPETRDGSAAAT